MGTLSVIITTLVACGSSEPAHEHEHHQHHDMQRRFDDPERWSAVFDAPERDAWQKPELIVARFANRVDMTVVDLGAGTGYFTVRFARALPGGQVVAVDIEPALLHHLEARARSDSLGNVTTHLSEPDDPRLGQWQGKVDLAFMCDTYHHIADRPAYFAKVAAVLAPDARVVIVDFELDSPRGPPREHKISADTVIAEMAGAGLALVSRSSELPDQYVLEFKKR